MALFVKRRSAQAQAVALMEDLALGEGLSGHGLTTKEVAKRVHALIKPNDILIHGKRVEAMFAFVAMSLGRCSLIREEDAGDVYAVEEVQPPDYRIALRDGGEILVEVKNFHQRSKPFSLKTEYVARLAAYGVLAQRPVKLAIYWSRWRIWTMVPLGALVTHGSKASIWLPAALMANEMSMLGDHMLATRPPLVIRLCSDPAKPRTIGTGGRFTIGKVELYCGGKLVTEPFEQQLVVHFMLFGRWTLTFPVEVKDNQLMWMDCVAEPEGEWEEQGFAMLGDASSMTSAQFDSRTVSMKGTIERLRPLADPSKFGIEIPSDYSGTDVPLWRFTLRPNPNTNQ